MLKGALRTLKERPPRHLLMEYTPGVTERAAGRNGSKWSEIGSYPRSLRNLLTAGYRIWHIGAIASKGDAHVLDADWDTAPLPPLREGEDEDDVMAEEARIAASYSYRQGHGDVEGTGQGSQGSQGHSRGDDIVKVNKLHKV